MTRRKFGVSMLVLLLASAVFGVKLEWVNLFSGKNLAGWRIYVNG